jgi:hypothetical protein
VPTIASLGPWLSELPLLGAEFDEVICGRAWLTSSLAIEIVPLASEKKLSIASPLGCCCEAFVGALDTEDCGAALCATLRVCEGGFDIDDRAVALGVTLAISVGIAVLALLALEVDDTTVGAFDFDSDETVLDDLDFVLDLLVLTAVLDLWPMFSLFASMRSGLNTASMLLPSTSMIAAL